MSCPSCPAVVTRTGGSALPTAQTLKEHRQEATPSGAPEVDPLSCETEERAALDHSLSGCEGTAAGTTS